LEADRLDKDGIGEFGADAEARVADLADKIAVAAEEFDALFLEKAHFTKAAHDFLGGGELFDADDRTGLHATQRADGWMGTLALPDDLRILAFFHCPLK
jgi:hypothetical protein